MKLLFCCLTGWLPHWVPFRVMCRSAQSHTADVRSYYLFSPSVFILLHKFSLTRAKCFEESQTQSWDTSPLSCLTLSIPVFLNIPVILCCWPSDSERCTDITLRPASYNQLWLMSYRRKAEPSYHGAFDNKNPSLGLMGWFAKQYFSKSFSPFSLLKCMYL